MTQLILKTTYRPTGEVVEYGPWPQDNDVETNIRRTFFAQGFVLGSQATVLGDAYKIEDFEFEVLSVEPKPDNNVVGTLVAEASASVTHADGTVS